LQDIDIKGLTAILLKNTSLNNKADLDSQPDFRTIAVHLNQHHAQFDIAKQ